MSNSTELLVVRKDQLSALMNAAISVLHERQPGEVESIIQDEFLASLKNGVDGLVSRPVLESLFHVEASGNDAEEPVLVVLPPDADKAKVTEVFDAAVKRAASISADGEGTGYFEALQESLAQWDILVTQSLNNLQAGPWDQSENLPEPDSIQDDDPEWVRVRVSGEGVIGADYEPMRLLDGTPVDFKADVNLDFLGFVESLTYKYPRGDKYGVPEAATDAGAREFVVDEMGFACSRKFNVMAVDTGDDSISSYVAECVMPRDILVPVYLPADRMKG